MKLKLEWFSGNRVDLLENGDAYLPALYEAIDAAKQEVVIETFILFEDLVGRDLQQHLIDAASRGVEVDLTVDGFGSPDLSAAFISALTDAGVRLHIYEPTPFVRHLNPLRRLHRKLAVVDGRVAFVGGINFSEDHLESFGAKAKQDYAVRIEGAAVERIHSFTREPLAPVQRQLKLGLGRRRMARRDAGQAVSPVAARQRPAEVPGVAEVAFVSRDNRYHRTDIERAYRMAIRAARDTVFIANAYFFPGYRLLRDLRRAAARGVAVHLILQNDPDVPIARVAGRLLYESLMKDGVTIHEYCRREMHGKVAVVDGIWSTVGSSNLDPLSLSLNLEANVLIRDAEFAATLQQRLQYLIEHDCEQTKRDALPRLTMWRYLLGSLAYHVSRGFPRWLSALPHFSWRIRSFARGRHIDTKAAVDARRLKAMTARNSKAEDRSGHGDAAPSRWGQAWQRARRVVLIAFALAVLGLIAWRAREIDWDAVLGALRALPLTTVALAGAIAIAAHAAYISYDLLARRYTGHRLGIGRTLAVAGVSFAFNLNLGALVGGVALRYRLYSRFGLGASVITRIVGFSLLTNWIGYLALAGAAFASGLVELPDDAPISDDALRVLGTAMLLAAAAYLAACRWSQRRRWSVRSHTIELPRACMAALQIATSATHWSLIATVLYVLLQGKVGFVTVLGTLLVSSVAGVITHIPAGLGVLEAVFLSLLAGAYSANELLAALLAYRAVFYLGPLIIAGVIYLALELSARRTAPKHWGHSRHTRGAG